MKTPRIAGMLALAAMAPSGALPTALAAQQSPAQAQISRKNLAPVSQQVVPVHLPKPVVATLPNGLTLMILEDHRLPLITATLHVNGAGGLYDSESQPGLAAFTASLMTQGTATRSADRIAEQSEDLGATVGVAATATGEDATLSASGLSSNFAQWFPLAVDVLLHPSFPADRIAQQKQRTLIQLRQSRTNSATLAGDRFAAAIFGSFPASRTETDETAVNTVTRDGLVEWHQTRYVPQNSILAIAGDVKPAALTAQIQAWLGGWARTNAPAPAVAGAPQPAAKRAIYLIDRPGSVQSTIYMGNLAINRTSPDYFPLLVLNQVFGAGAQSRLFMNLREQRGLTYGVNSVITLATYPGPWRAYGNFRTEVTGEAMEQMYFEINRIRDEKVPAAELADAERGLAAGFARSLENPDTVLGDYVTARGNRLPADYWDTYTAKIMAVTSDDVQRVARSYMNMETLQVVVVGDGAKIHADLAKYGPVELYGTDGKPAATAAASAGN